MRDIIYIAIGAIGIGIIVKAFKENILVSIVVAAATWVLILAPVIHDLGGGSSGSSSCPVGGCQTGSGNGGPGVEPREGVDVSDVRGGVRRPAPVVHPYTPLHPRFFP